MTYRRNWVASDGPGPGSRNGRCVCDGRGRSRSLHRVSNRILVMLGPARTTMTVEVGLVTMQEHASDATLTGFPST